jgi:hypothetical protein
MYAEAIITPPKKNALWYIFIINHIIQGRAFILVQWRHGWWQQQSVCTNNVTSATRLFLIKKHCIGEDRARNYAIRYTVTVTGNEWPMSPTNLSFEKTKFVRCRKIDRWGQIYLSSKNCESQFVVVSKVIVIFVLFIYSAKACLRGKTRFCLGI